MAPRPALLGSLLCLALVAAPGPAATGDDGIAVAQLGLERWSREAGLGGSWVTAIVEDGHGFLWVGTTRGLWRTGPKGLSSVPLGGAGRPPEVRQLVAGPDGAIWGRSVDHGICRVDEGAVASVPDAPGCRGESLVFAPDGLPITGCEHGIWERPAAAPAWTLVSPVVRSDRIFVDREGALWFATREGLAKRFGESDGLPTGRVWALALDVERPGGLWVGTQKGIVALEDRRPHRVERPGGRTDEEVTVVYADPVRPGTVWASGPSGGADEVRGDSVRRHGDENGREIGRVSVFRRVRSGALLAAGERGVFSYDGSRWQRVRLGGKAVTVVQDLAEAEDGTLWIASRASGLHRWSRGTLATLGVREGLPYQDVHPVQLDGTGGLWLSGDDGLARLRLDDLDRWARGELGEVPVDRLAARDGQRDHECNGWGRPASWARPDGTFVSPTLKGIALLDPARLARTPGLAYSLANRAAAAVHGMTPDELEGRSADGGVPPVQGMERILALDRTVIAGGDEAVLHDARLVDATGAERWYRVVDRPLLGPDGAIEQVVGSAVDITDHELAEEKLRRSESQLAASQDELRRLASDLLRAQEEERAASRGRSTTTSRSGSSGSPCRRASAPARSTGSRQATSHEASRRSAASSRGSRPARRRSRATSTRRSWRTWGSRPPSAPSASRSGSGPGCGSSTRAGRCRATSLRRWESSSTGSPRRRCATCAPTPARTWPASRSRARGPLPVSRSRTPGRASTRRSGRAGGGSAWRA